MAQIARWPTPKALQLPGSNLRWDFVWSPVANRTRHSRIGSHEAFDNDHAYLRLDTTHFPLDASEVTA